MASWDGLREGALGQRPRQEGAGRLLCVPTWRHRKAWKPDSPPALLQAVIPLRPRRALRRLVPHVPVAAPMASVSEGRWTGEEAPVLSECGSWGSVEPGSIFSSVEPERVPKLPLVSHSPPTPCQLLLPGPSLPSTGRMLESLCLGPPVFRRAPPLDLGSAGLPRTPQRPTWPPRFLHCKSGFPGGLCLSQELRAEASQSLESVSGMLPDRDPSPPVRPSDHPSVRPSVCATPRSLLAHSLQACSLPASAAHSVHCSSPAWTPDPRGGDTPVLPAHTMPSAMTSAVPRPWSHLLPAPLGAKGPPILGLTCAPHVPRAGGGPASWARPLPLMSVRDALHSGPALPGELRFFSHRRSEDEGRPWAPGWAAGTSLLDQPPLTSSGRPS